MYNARACPPGGEAISRKVGVNMDYVEQFEKLIEAGVPKWYIRLYVLDHFKFRKKVSIKYNPYEVNTERGWCCYTGDEDPNLMTEADKNRKCYGTLEYLGRFPEWEEYRTLFEGDEWDAPRDFELAYEQHKREFEQ